MASVVSMKSLLEAGVHFGHQTRRWNPKMAPPEGNFLPAVETALQPPVRRDADSAAVPAKFVAQGGDKPHRSNSPRQTEPPRYALRRQCL